MHKYYKAVILYIDNNGLERAVSIDEIVKATGASRATVRRILVHLVRMKYIRYVARSFNHRHWITTKNWLDATSVIDTYETWMLASKAGFTR